MDGKYIISQNGRQFVRFEGLLLAAHDAGLSAVKTALLQAPSEGNGQTAIVQAEVTTARGTFTGIGDASPQSVARHLAPHVCRMAETRALARALRFALGVAAVAVEELSGEGDGEPARATAARPAAISTAWATTSAQRPGMVATAGRR